MKELKIFNSLNQEVKVVNNNIARELGYALDKISPAEMQELNKTVDNILQLQQNRGAIKESREIFKLQEYATVHYLKQLKDYDNRKDKESILEFFTPLLSEQELNNLKNNSNIDKDEAIKYCCNKCDIDDLGNSKLQNNNYER